MGRGGIEPSTRGFSVRPETKTPYTKSLGISLPEGEPWTLSDVQTLLTKCREIGAELSTATHGHLKVKALAPLPKEVMGELRQHKAEVMAALSQESLPCSCPQCSGQVQFEPEDEYAFTRLWLCACETWGVIREGAAYPVVWISIPVVQ
jgi:hypothetical protein